MAPEMGWEEGPKCQTPGMTRRDVCAFHHEPLWLRVSARAEHNAWLQAREETAGRDRQGQEQKQELGQAEAEEAGRGSSRQGRGRQGLAGVGRGMPRQEEGRG